MPKLELFASGPGTGKTTRCIDIFRREILRSPAGIDSRSYFVLPNREHAARIQNLVLKKDIPGLFNVHILTIQELGLRLAAFGAPPAPGESMRRAVLRHILEDPAESWEYFSPVKDLEGFYALLSERIQEFKSATLDADEFEKRGRLLARDPVFGAKSRDFAKLIRRYDAELAQRGYAETEDSLARARTGSPGRSAGLVILDGFYHFTQSQKELIESLTKRTSHMVVTLTLPASSVQRPHVFEWVESTKRYLVRVGFKSSAAGLSRNCRVAEPELLHLERNLFLPKPVKLGGRRKALQMLTAETPYDEIETIAREIRRLHRDTEWHYSDIAVILRGVQAYEKSITPIFSEYGIPFAVHERKKAIESGLGKFLYRFLKLSLEGWRDTDLLPLLKSDYAPVSPDTDAVARLERIAHAQKAGSGRETWVRLAGEEGCEPVREALAWLAEAEDGLKRARNARETRAQFRKFLGQIRIEADTDGAPLRAIEDLVERAETPEEFLRSLETGLYSQKPSGKNRVQVYDTVMAIPKEYRVVFIAGLLDQLFPQTVMEDPLFKDREREALNGRQRRLEIRSARHAGERYFFYMAVTRARNRLYLSHPQKDRDGKPYLPSVFIEEVRRCFADLPVLKVGTDGASAPSAWVAETQAEKAVAQKLFAQGLEIKEEERQAVLAYASSRRRHARFAGVLEAGGQDDRARLSDPRILKVVREQAAVFSPTRLETFLTCPFKYFADYTLELKPYLEDRLRAETGTMLHKVLEKYYSEERRSSQLYDDLEREFEKSPLASEPLYRRRYLMKQARRTLALFLRSEKEAAESRFEPKYFELTFGKKHGGGAARLPYLEIGKEPVRVSGSVDRIDVSPDGKQALVIDYKLGHRDLNKKIKDGIEVQLPLYALVARDLLKLDPHGAELHFLESGKRSPALEGERLKELLAETEKRVLDAARRVREGDIAVRSKSCHRCHLSALCRFEPWKLVYNEVDRV